MSCYLGSDKPVNWSDILVLQKRVLRFIHFLDKREHAIPFFVATNILPVNILFYENVLTLMHDVKNRAAPVNILNLFQNTSDIHSYNTRSSKSNNFYIKQSKLEIQRKSFSYVGAKWWNEVPSCIRELPKKKHLRKGYYKDRYVVSFWTFYRRNHLSGHRVAQL